MMMNWPHKAEPPLSPCRIAVVIPCFKVTQHILAVLAAIGPEASRIVVVDDACPERSGDFVTAHATDPRIMVLRHAFNKGVGGGDCNGLRSGDSPRLRHHSQNRWRWADEPALDPSLC